MLPELFSAHEYAALMQMAVRYLQSANTDDAWGRTINMWPVANAEDVPKYVEHFRKELLVVGELAIKGSTRAHGPFDTWGRNISWWKSSIPEDAARYPLEIAKALFNEKLDAPVPEWYVETSYSRRSDAIRALNRRGVAVDGMDVYQRDEDMRWAIRARA